MIGVGRKILDKRTRKEYTVFSASQDEDDQWVYWAEGPGKDPEVVIVSESELEKKYYLELPLHKEELRKLQQGANSKHHRKNAITISELR